jgi:hypothetical protein
MSGRLISGTRTLTLTALAERVGRAASAFASIGIGCGVGLLLRNDFVLRGRDSGGTARCLLGADQLAFHGGRSRLHHQGFRRESRRCTHRPSAGHREGRATGRSHLRGRRAARNRGSLSSVTRQFRDLAAEIKVWDAWIERFPPRPPEQIEPPGAIFYTSGTTGRPRVCAVTHQRRRKRLR